MARIYRATYTAKGPDGNRVVRKSRKWYIDHVDADGIRRRVAGFTDRRATEQRAAELERETDRRRVGLIDRYAEHRKRPLTAHVDDWHKALCDKGNTRKHADLLAGRLRKVLAGCRFTFWPDLSASKVQSWLSELRQNGASVRTANFYLQATKQFCRWCVRDGRAPDSPLAHLEGGNARTDRRHDRQAFTPDELRQLIGMAESGSVCYGVPGRDRAMLYRVPTETGLRSGELRSLTVGSFALRADPPTATVAAAYSKHRREDVLPIRPELADMLRAYFAGKLPTAKAFKMPSASNVARMLRRDLDAARVAWIDDAGTEDERQRREDSDFLIYRDDAGRFLDFHALRHTFITNLARGGVHPKLAQQLARHSTITLTMDRYSHTVMGDLSDALTALPDLDHPPAEQTRQRATGTFDAAASDDTRETARPDERPKSADESLGHSLGLLLGQTGYGECRSMSAADATAGQCHDDGTVRRGNKNGGSDASCRGMSSAVNNAPGRTRTCDLRFRKPLLYPAELRAQLSGQMITQQRRRVLRTI